MSRPNKGGTVVIVVRGALVMSAVATAMVFAGCSDKTTGDTQTLKLTENERQGDFGVIGSPTHNHTRPGQGFSLSIPLQDSSEKPAGEINAVCIATQPSSSEDLTGACSGVADVPDGQLALQVGGPITQGVTGAIVGGTGKYEGATGTFTSPDKGPDTFTVTLP
jgi:hypothetical protein